VPEYHLTSEQYKAWVKAGKPSIPAFLGILTSEDKTKQVSGPNELEKQFMRFLEALAMAKEIESFEYEPLPAFEMFSQLNPYSSKLTKVTYLPDFVVKLNNGKVLVYETKGHMWEKDKLRFIWAAEKNTDKRFMMIERNRNDWKIKFDINPLSVELPHVLNFYLAIGGFNGKKQTGKKTQRSSKSSKITGK
jgi:hypothetical protein